MKLIINCTKFFLVVISCLLINNSFGSIKSKSSIQTLDGSNAPADVIFFDENAKEYSLDKFEGSTVLLVFWATWCGSCVNEILDLNALQKDFRRLPFKIIAVSQDDQGIELVKQRYESYKIDYLPIYHDYKKQLFKAFKVVGLPTSILISPEGKKLVSFIGNTNWYDEEVRAIILSHIPGNPAEPKNSYQKQTLNQPVHPIKPKEVEDSKNIKQDKPDEKSETRENNEENKS